MKEKMVQIRIPETLRKKIKIMAAKKGVSVWRLLHALVN